MKNLETLEIASWEHEIPNGTQTKAVNALENGKVLFFPALPFKLSAEEEVFLSPDIVDPKTKNISYDLRSDTLKGSVCTDAEDRKLKSMIKRYALNSRKLLETLIPHYQSFLIQGKTSFRPVEIFGRKISEKKDDTRLHVDSFPSNPVKGQRILRVFTNINPHGKPRVWRLGEPFQDVVKKIAPRVSRPFPGVAPLFKMLGITKDLRTPYDHYMLKIHDTMKLDQNYQNTVYREEVNFPAGSSWIVYTDQVSHAAISGQHVLEQTFYLQPNGNKNKETAPLYVLEKHFNRALV